MYYGVNSMEKPELIIFADPRRRYAAEAVESFVDFVADKANILAIIGEQKFLLRKVL